MNIHHRPIFDTEAIIKHYSEKDGVPVKYICTSAVQPGAAFAADIFYRDTPHPEFGNRYFGLYVNPYADDTQIMIANADKVESANFDMVDVDGTLHYSQHRHDFYSVGDVSIDGGRAYLRRVGNINYPVVSLRLKDGEFVMKEGDSDV